MGWLNEEQQRATKKKYKVRCLYECDYCHLPIPPGVLYEVDPKGGYYPWPKTMPKNCQPFNSRQPKVTYHVGGECGDTRKGKNKRKQLKKLIIQAAEYILDKIEANAKKKWTKERCISKLSSKGYDEKVVKKAMRFIRKEKLVRKRKGVYIVI